MTEPHDRGQGPRVATETLRRRAGIGLAGTVLAAGVAGLLAGSHPAFADPDGVVLCQSRDETHVFYGAGDCDVDSGNGPGNVNFGSDASLDVGSAHLSTGVDGLSTFDTNVTVDGLLQAHQATINQGTISGSLSVVNGASVNMGGNRVTNVGTPTGDSDAATKKYVDDLMDSGSTHDAEQDTRIEEVDTDSRSRDTALDNRITSVDNDSKARDTAQDTHIAQVDSDSRSRDAAQDTRLDGHDATLATHTLQIADLDDRVTTNTQDIAALGGAVDGLDQRMTAGFSRLDGRIDRAFEGSAMAMAMAAPSMPPDKNYAVSINWGGFEGANAFAGTAQARISDHLMIHGGIGYGTGSHSVGGRAGLTFGW